MSSTAGLQGRLKELSTSLGQIQPLVNRLHDFTASIGQGDEARLELGSEIHSRLKDAEQELELLRVDVEALDTGTDSRPKRNAEIAKRKERELLLSRSTKSEKKQPSERFTQDDLVLNASNDVTSALRRTHQLMQAELSRSAFAQETLDQSTVAINSLSESYSGLDTLLSSSRSLANSLLRSQKSDTWYLETAFYVLIGTITWLVFRRVLYGPLWWLLWLPLKLIARVVFAALGVAGLSSTAVQSSADSISGDFSSRIHETATAVMGGTVTSSAAWEEPPVPADTDRVIDEIGRMVEKGKEESTGIDDITPEERERQDALPRNTKKRMYEDEPVRDEL
ncbi:hypothetical protein N7508_005525 [Penicillium antarcticum]|uniref:uncharacterized protein n=1 Tax=Penicillium antarcticum TaxID=416450 RepID=UPI002388BF23|nr:uncharacterized protein N7508_005525 [Penicillium antarcticum]KAJ5306510.1 hypothetical protein N7508_005525 [Penicillium antarcticum]